MSIPRTDKHRLAAPGTGLMVRHSESWVSESDSPGLDQGCTQNAGRDAQEETPQLGVSLRARWWVTLAPGPPALLAADRGRCALVATGPLRSVE